MYDNLHNKINRDDFNQFLKKNGLEHYQAMWRDNQIFVVRDDTSSFECRGESLGDLLMSALNTSVGPAPDKKEDGQEIIQVSQADKQFIYMLIQYGKLKNNDAIDFVKEECKKKGEKYERFLKTLES